MNTIASEAAPSYDEIKADFNQRITNNISMCTNSQEVRNRLSKEALF